MVVAIHFGDAVGPQKLGILGDHLRRDEPRLALAHQVNHHSAVGHDVHNKGVAILDYALGNRPSTGRGEVGGRLCPQRARRQLVPARTR